MRPSAASFAAATCLNNIDGESQRLPFPLLSSLLEQRQRRFEHQSGERGCHVPARRVARYHGQPLPGNRFAATRARPFCQTITKSTGLEVSDWTSPSQLAGQF